MVRKITTETHLYKVIPASSIEKIMIGQYDSKVGGFVARADDVGHLKNYDEIVEGLRLDYSQTPFVEGGSEYGLIKFRVTKPEQVSIPYDKSIGGVEAKLAPCTGNGFTACRNGEVIPEWEAVRELPQDGAELYRVINGKEELVGEYVKSKGRFVEPKNR